MTALDTDQPHFDLEEVQLQFDLHNDLQMLLVGSNKMYIVTSTIIYRIDLDNPSRVTRVHLPVNLGSAEITNSWLHPSGNFLIVQVNSRLYFHLHISYQKLKSLPRLKGLQIEFISFDSQKKDSLTGDFLISTVEGAIFVASIHSHNTTTQENKRDDKYVKQVYTSKKKIKGLHWSSDTLQVYLFLEGENLTWQCIEPTLAEFTRIFHRQPDKSIFVESDENFAFHISHQKYYRISNQSGRVESDDQELLYSSGTISDWDNYGLGTGSQSIAVSKHHLILLSADHKKIAVLNKLILQHPVFIELPSSNGSKILGVTSDYIGNTTWLFTRNSIHEIVITNEAISVWYSYYKMGDYEQALKLLEKNNEVKDIEFKKSVILVKQGYELLQSGGFGAEFSNTDKSIKDKIEIQKRGIRKLAKSQEPFEKVTLMLMSTYEDSTYLSVHAILLLIEYLLVKLYENRQGEQSKMVNIILSSWITNLYLKSILKMEKYLCHEESDSSNVIIGLNYKQQIEKLESDLFSFLQKHHKIMDQSCIYRLMLDMNFNQQLVRFAEMLHDYEFVTYYHIENEEWLASIQSLNKLYNFDPVKAKQVIYDISFVMISKIPRPTVEFWLKFDDLDFEKLLPALIRFNEHNKALNLTKNVSIQFIQKLIHEKNVKSSLLNNFFLTTLISHSVTDDENYLNKFILQTMEFLRSDSSNYKKNSPYDYTFLLRLSIRFDRIQSAISILVHDLNQYDSALTLALDKRSCSLAEIVLKQFNKFAARSTKQNSAISERTVTFFQSTDILNTIKFDNDHFAFKKRLWMKYARFLIDGICNVPNFQLPTNALFDDCRSFPDQGSDYRTQLEQHIEIKAKTDVEHSTTHSHSLSKIVQYLSELSGANDPFNSIVSLKDLLPLFPESVRISEFRNDVIETLNSFNTQINQLAWEMQDSASTAHKLKAQIDNFETRHAQGQICTIIEPGESCRVCSKILIKKSFLVFPNCHHAFHKECVIRYYLQSKGDYRFKKLFQKFKHNTTHPDDKFLDELLLEECFLCNESTVNTIDDELIDPEKNVVQIEEWSI